MTPPTHLLQNVRVPLALLNPSARSEGETGDDCAFGDLIIREGIVERLTAPDTAPADWPRSDAGGRIVMPRLAEAHCHLDKCHTVARIGNVGGNLHAAIDAQARDKANWSAEDLRERAQRGLAELAAAGCSAVRTHVDWEEPAELTGAIPPAWQVIGELAAEWSGTLTVQRVALLPVETFENLDATRGIVECVARSAGGVLGVFVFNQPEKPRWLRAAFELAQHYALPLDFHVDEGLEDGLDGLEVIADLIVETGFAQPVLCGHACSLSALASEHVQRTLDKVAAARLSVVSLPTTNLYLQDRGDGCPQRRGLTRVRELAQGGVPVLFGSDNVRDAFCPLGAHDPMAALATAALAAHLDPPYGPWLRAVTTYARTALGLSPVFVEGAAVSDLLIAEATHTTELVAGAPRGPLRDYGSPLPLGEGSTLLSMNQLHRD